MGQHDFLWTIDNGPCGTSSDTVSVFIFDSTAPDASAGVDQELCTPATSTTLEGNAVVFPATGSWTVVTGTGVFADASDPTTTVSGLSIGTNTFRWTIVNEPCGTSQDDVTITVFDNTQASANAGSDQQICTPTASVTLSGNTANFPAVGTWVFVSGTGSLSDPNAPNATLSGLSPGTVVLQWNIDNGPCGSTTDNVTIEIFNNTAPVASAGTDQHYCSDGLPNTISMSANAPSAPAIGTWTLVSGRATITDANSATTTVTGLGTGANVFLWTISNGPCGTTSDNVTITVFDANEVTAEAGVDQLFCQDVSTATLDATPTTSTGVGVWTLISGTGIIEQPGSANSDVSGLTLGTNVFVWSVFNGDCGTTRDTMIIVIKDCITITIPDAFSPNGDGVNDNVQILNIESYPNNDLIIFNRWGNKVYEASPYTNGQPWDGTSQFGSVFGEGLPESTYYYVLKLGNDTEPYTGYIYL
ncbi:MAG TPA: gliding motility-associated C-terminal domain-containing protein, partial [Flavobacteriales bacterium]|nr:gliding motility-associated C-terminal domain-containing protein [Flavobacteriales bacterium]